MPHQTVYDYDRCVVCTVRWRARVQICAQVGLLWRGHLRSGLQVSKRLVGERRLGSWQIPRFTHITTMISEKVPPCDSKLRMNLGFHGRHSTIVQLELRETIVRILLSSDFSLAGSMRWDSSSGTIKLQQVSSLALEFRCGIPWLDLILSTR